MATPSLHAAALPSAWDVMHPSISASRGSNGTGAQTDSCGTAQSLPRHITDSPLAAFSFFLGPRLFPRHVFRAQSIKEGRSAVGFPLQHRPLPLFRVVPSARDRLAAPRALQVTLRSVLPPPGAGGGGDPVGAGGRLKPYPCLQVEDQLHLPASPQEPDSP